jgi:hypothetical protein
MVIKRATREGSTELVYPQDVRSVGGSDLLGACRRPLQIGQLGAEPSHFLAGLSLLLVDLVEAPDKLAPTSDKPGQLLGRLAAWSAQLEVQAVPPTCRDHRFAARRRPGVVDGRAIPVIRCCPRPGATSGRQEVMPGQVPGQVCWSDLT